MNITDKGDDDLLKQTQSDILQELLPAVVSLSVFCLIGILGNTLTMIFYVKKPKRSSAVIMILALAVVDLLVCVSMILSIFEMAALVTYYSSVLCQLTHFLGRWTIGSSCLILWMISIDRHRKVCKPFGKQVTVSSAKVFVLALVVVSFLLSVKELAHYGSLEIAMNASNSNRSITGHYCKEKEGSAYNISISIFNGIDAILITMILVTQIVVYSLIIYRLVKLRLKRNAGEIPTKTHSKVKLVEVSGIHGAAVNRGTTLDTDCNDLNISESNTSVVTHIVDTNNTSIENTTKRSTDDGMGEKIPPAVETENVRSERNEAGLSYSPPGHNETKDSKLKGIKHVMNVKEMTPTELKLTVMMFSVSLVFLLCFIPYFVMVLTSLAAGKKFELKAGIKFAIRLPYLNSVFNPIVYCVFNAELRHYVRHVIVGKCLRCTAKT